MKQSSLSRRTPLRSNGATKKQKREPWIKPKARVDLSRMDCCPEAKARAVALIALGCIACGRRSKVEIHHIRHGHGMGQRAPWWETIPLCHEHHTGSVSGYCTHGAYRNEFHYDAGSEVELLARVNAMLDESLCKPPG